MNECLRMKLIFIFNFLKFLTKIACLHKLINSNGNESKTTIKKSNRPSIASNSAFQRFHNSILNANNNNNNNVTNTTNSNKIQPRKLNLINNGTIQFSRDDNNSIHNSNDASVLHKAHKILQYVVFDFKFFRSLYFNF